MALGVTNWRGAIINGAFHSVPGNEQCMIGEPDDLPHVDDLLVRALDRLMGEFVDYVQHCRDVLAPGFSSWPPGKDFRHRVHKRHTALAVSHQDCISDTRQRHVQQCALFVRVRLRLPALRDHGGQDKNRPRRQERKVLKSEKALVEREACKGTGISCRPPERTGGH